MDYQETTSDDLDYICAVYEEALRRQWDADYHRLHDQTAAWRVQVFSCPANEFTDIIEAATRVLQDSIFPHVPRLVLPNTNNPLTENDNDL